MRNPAAPLPAIRVLPPLEAGAPSLRTTAAQSIRSAFDGLVAHKLRSALTIIGIVVGVAALLLVLDLGEITEEYVKVQWAHVGANLVEVTFNPPPGMGKADVITHSTLTVEDVQALQRLPHVAAISPQVFELFPVAAGSINLTGAVFGSFPSIQTLQSLTLARGTFYTDQDEATGAAVAVLGPRAAEYLFRGSDPVGQELRIGTVNFRVVGVVSPAADVPDDPFGDNIYVPFSTYQQRLTRQLPPFILLEVDRRENVQDMLAAATQTLDQRHRAASAQARDFWVSYNDASTDAVVQQLTLQRTVMGLVAGIALLIGGFGIGSTMLMAVRQRRREIGIRVAVGARPADILRQFLAEAVALSLLGALLGVLASCAVVYGFYFAYRNAPLGHSFRDAVQSHMLPSPAGIAVALAAVVLIGVVSGYYPARRAARMDPIQALRQ